MGDVSTHAEINHFVASQMRAVAPATLVPHEHYTYLELGNYLTDLSQFRDPVAHHAARRRAHMAGLLRAAKVGAFVLSPVTVPMVYLLGLVGWTHRVFGEKEPEGRRHGDLAEFFRRISLAIAHQAFTQEGREALALSIARRTAVPPDVARDALTEGAMFGLPPLTPEELDRVHEAHFTQYWPHEHLDFPPVADAEEHRTMLWFVDSPRKVQPYLDVHAQALAQQLAVLELDWVRHTAAPAQHPQDLVVRLGHLLHAIEDFWFHSNAPEVYRWGRSRLAHPDLDPDDPAALMTLLDAALVDGGVPTTVRHRRLLRRRLRYPVYTGSDLDDLSDETSADGTGLVFTGGFGATDIFHTLGKALESMETGRFTAPVASALAESGLTLFRLLLREADRTAMVDDGDESDLAGQHEDELRDGTIHARLDELHSDGELCDRAHAELRRAFDLDKEVEEEWSSFPGLGGVLIQMLGLMQEERTASKNRSVELDEEPDGDIPSTATTNGASGENVGTHSLMAKDSRASDPFRDDAVRLAKHASASVATLLIDRVRTGAPETQGIDWPAVLEACLPFPEPNGAHWWTGLLGNPTPPNAPQPDVAAFPVAPGLALLGPGDRPQVLADLRAGTRVAELETYYREFEE